MNQEPPDQTPRDTLATVPSLQHLDALPAGASHGGTADDDLRLLADSASDFAMIFTDPQRTVVRWSQGAQHVLGWSEEEAINKNERDLIYTPEDQAANIPQQEQDTALREGRAIDDRWHVKKDGTRFWANGVMVPLYDPETHHLRGFGKVLRDQTERKRLEDELRASVGARSASEERFRLAAAAVQAIIYDWDVGTDRVSRTHGLEEILGYSEEEVGPTMTDWARVFHPDDRARVSAAGRANLDNPTATTYILEYRARHKDGSYRYLSDHGLIVRDEQRRAVRVVGSAIDVTGQRQTEERLRASEAWLSAIFARAAVGLSEISLDGLFLRVNDEVCRILGRSREELLTIGIPEVTHPDDIPPSRDALVRAARSGQTASLDKRYIRPDGTEVWANSSATLLRDAAGKPQAFLVVTADLTQRKRYETWLEQTNEVLEARVTERTEELGALNRDLSAKNDELRAEVARRERAETAHREVTRRVVAAQEEERRHISRELHDEMGQLLTGLVLGLKSLADSLSGPDPAQAVLAGQDHVITLRDITERMTREVHRLAVELRPTALDDLGLRAALGAYVEDWGRRTGTPVEFVTSGLNLERLPSPVETTVYRVVQEALNNAAKYACRTDLAWRATQVAVTVQRRGDNLLRVTVEDDGPGFDVEVARKSGRLGLVGMQERAVLAGGSVSIESAPGKGTTVFLQIPLQ